MWRGCPKPDQPESLHGLGQSTAAHLPRASKIGFGKYNRLEEMGIQLGVLRALILEKSRMFLCIHVEE
jgi:hypothetical protein